MKKNLGEKIEFEGQIFALHQVWSAGFMQISVMAEKVERVD